MHDAHGRTVPEIAGGRGVRSRAVAYDDELAARIRGMLAGEADLTEKRMFGGLAFLVGGNMAIAASGQGGIMVRVDPAESGALVSGTAATMAEMRGKAMPGWLRVSAEHLEGDADLEEWVGRGVGYARSLPAKG